MMDTTDVAHWFADVGQLFGILDDELGGREAAYALVNITTDNLSKASGNDSPLHGKAREQCGMQTSFETEPMS